MSRSVCFQSVSIPYRKIHRWWWLKNEYNVDVDQGKRWLFIPNNDPFLSVSIKTFGKKTLNFFIGLIMCNLWVNMFSLYEFCGTKMFKLFFSLDSLTVVVVFLPILFNKTKSNREKSPKQANWYWSNRMCYLIDLHRSMLHF